MKKLLLLLIYTFASIAPASAPEPYDDCFDELPGEVNIPYDTPDRVKITELKISNKGDTAFVATEYLGSANLQASVYMLRNERYCLAGDLGAAIDFKASVQGRGDRYFALIVESKSGQDKFLRTFKYKHGNYRLASCVVRSVGARERACTESEK